MAAGLPGRARAPTARSKWRRARWHRWCGQRSGRGGSASSCRSIRRGEPSTLTVPRRRSPIRLSDADRVAACADPALARRSTSRPRSNCPPCCATATGRCASGCTGTKRSILRCLAVASLGLAVDLGTTNVAGFLIDLQSGVSVASLGNRESAGRLGRRRDQPDQSRDARPGRRRGTAHGRRRRDQRARARPVPAQSERRRGDIVDVAICGNTAMHHLLLGLPVRPARPRAIRGGRARRRWTSRRANSACRSVPAPTCIWPRMSAVLSAAIMSPPCSPPNHMGSSHDEPRHGYRHQHRNFADPPRRDRDRLLPVRPGAGGRSHLLRHARSGRRDRARLDRGRPHRQSE